MQSEIEMRLLRTGDAGSLAALETAVFADAWDGPRFAELLAQDRFVAVGALRGAKLLGYVTAYSIEGEMEIVNVAVRADERGHGLGGRIMRYFLAHAQACGVSRIFLEVRAGNTAAMALYARTGFVRAGVRKRYYADSGEDALILVWAGPSETDLPSTKF